MNLLQLLEEMSPGHFSQRNESLERLKEKVQALGFFPLHLTPHDVECFWIRIEPNESNRSRKIHVTHDEIEWPTYVEALKEVARYEER